MGWEYRYWQISEEMIFTPGYLFLIESLLRVFPMSTSRHGRNGIDGVCLSTYIAQTKFGETHDSAILDAHTLP